MSDHIFIYGDDLGDSQEHVDKQVKKSDPPASQGLGDTIAKFTSATKLDVVAEQIAKAVGAEDCGCKARRKKLNQIFPYKTIK